jgi:hypothetical protein
MKKLFLFAFCLLGLYSVNAQDIEEDKLPKQVREKFRGLYPNAQEVDWELNSNIYEGSFDIDEDHELTVFIDSKGNLLRTETEIEFHKLPGKVLEYTARHYKGKKIDDAVRIKDSKGKVTYHVNISEADLFFDEKGNILSGEIKNSQNTE